MLIFLPINIKLMYLLSKQYSFSFFMEFNFYVSLHRCFKPICNKYLTDKNDRILKTQTSHQSSSLCWSDAIVFCALL